MQEYRFNEGGYTIYITWDGEKWIVSRMGTVKNIRVGVGGSHKNRDVAIREVKKLYKRMKNLDIRNLP